MHANETVQPRIVTHPRAGEFTLRLRWVGSVCSSSTAALRRSWIRRVREDGGVGVTPRSRCAVEHAGLPPSATRGRGASHPRKDFACRVREPPKGEVNLPELLTLLPVL